MRISTIQSDAAARSVEFALQLCEVSKRQMPKIQAALTEQLSDAIAIAQNIPKTNQVAASLLRYKMWHANAAESDRCALEQFVFPLRIHPDRAASPFVCSLALHSTRATCTAFWPPALLRVGMLGLPLCFTAGQLLFSPPKSPLCSSG